MCCAMPAIVVWICGCNHLPETALKETITVLPNYPLVIVKISGCKKDPPLEITLERPLGIVKINRCSAPNHLQGHLTRPGMWRLIIPYLDQPHPRHPRLSQRNPNEKCRKMRDFWWTMEISATEEVLSKWLYWGTATNKRIIHIFQRPQRTRPRKDRSDRPVHLHKFLDQQ